MAALMLLALSVAGGPAHALIEISPDPDGGDNGDPGTNTKMAPDILLLLNTSTVFCLTGHLLSGNVDEPIFESRAEMLVVLPAARVPAMQAVPVVVRVRMPFVRSHR